MNLKDALNQVRLRGDVSGIRRTSWQQNFYMVPGSELGKPDVLWQVEDNGTRHPKIVYTAGVFDLSSEDWEIFM